MAALSCRIFSFTRTWRWCWTIAGLGWTQRAVEVKRGRNLDLEQNQTKKMRLGVPCAGGAVGPNMRVEEGCWLWCRSTAPWEAIGGLAGRFRIPERVPYTRSRSRRFFVFSDRVGAQLARTHACANCYVASLRCRLGRRGRPPRPPMTFTRPQFPQLGPALSKLEQQPYHNDDNYRRQRPWHIYRSF